MARPNVNPVDRLARMAWASHVRHLHGNRNFSSIAREHDLPDSARVMLYHISRGSRSPTSLLFISKQARPTFEAGPEGIPVWPVLRNMEITYDEFSSMLPAENPATAGLISPTFGDDFLGDPTNDSLMGELAGGVAMLQKLAADMAEEGQPVPDSIMQNTRATAAFVSDHRARQPWITFCQLIIDFRALLRIDLSPGLLSALARQHLRAGPFSWIETASLQTADERREFVRDLFDRLARKELMKADMEPYGLSVTDLMDVAHARL